MITIYATLAEMLSDVLITELSNDVMRAATQAIDATNARGNIANRSPVTVAATVIHLLSVVSEAEHYKVTDLAAVRLTREEQLDAIVFGIFLQRIKD